MMLRIIGIICLAMILNACSSIKEDSDHNAICARLKNRIIMSGSTPIQRIAQQQRNDLDRLQQSYRDEGCQ